MMAGSKEIAKFPPPIQLSIMPPYPIERGKAVGGVHPLGPSLLVDGDRWIELFSREEFASPEARSPAAAKLSALGVGWDGGWP